MTTATTEFIDAAEKEDADSFWADLNFVRDSLEDLEGRCDAYPDKVRSLLQGILVDVDFLLQDVDRFDGMVETLTKKDADIPDAQFCPPSVSASSVEDERWSGEYYYCAPTPKDEPHEREFYPAAVVTPRTPIAISGT